MSGVDALSVSDDESSDSVAAPRDGAEAGAPVAGAPHGIAVRRIAAEDGGLLRATRLAAIVDSPGVYSTTLAEAEAHPIVQWERVATASAVGGDQATWFAEVGPAVAGMVSAYRTADDVITMTSLWSAPGFRNAGVAETLVNAVAAWAVSIGGVQLRLWVVQRNEHARRFYQRLGFVATGAEMPYEPDPRLVENELRKPLA